MLHNMTAFKLMYIFSVDNNCSDFSCVYLKNHLKKSCVLDVNICNNQKTPDSGGVHCSCFCVASPLFPCLKCSPLIQSSCSATAPGFTIHFLPLLKVWMKLCVGLKSLITNQRTFYFSLSLTMENLEFHLKLWNSRKVCTVCTCSLLLSPIIKKTEATTHK